MRSATRVLALAAALAMPVAACKARTNGPSAAVKDIDATAFSPGEKSCEAAQSQALVLDKSIIITGDKIPESLGAPGGVAAFGTIIRNLVGPNATDDQVDAFLSKYTERYAQEKKTDKDPDLASVTSFEGVPGTILRRPGVAASFKTWPRKNGKLDIAAIPKKLVAVVNRLDLWNGQPDDAGETRLVFADTAEGPYQMIFEFRNPVSKGNLRAWATKWADLSKTKTPAEFAAGLTALVRDVTGPDVAANESMKRGQVRVNEFIDGPWLLREFKLGSDGLQIAIAKQAATFGDGVKRDKPPEELMKFIVANTARIADGQLIDGFLPLQPLSVHTLETRSSGNRFTLPADVAAAVKEKAKELTADDFACLADKSSLPKEVRDEVKKKATNEDKLLAAVTRGVEAANCSGCHSSAPFAGSFTHINSSGDMSAFVESEAVPARKRFLSLAACTDKPKFVRSTCFKSKDVPAAPAASGDEDYQDPSELIAPGSERVSVE